MDYDLIISNDPGATGGITVLFKNGEIEVYKIPVKSVIINKKNKNIYDIDEIFNLLSRFKDKKVGSDHLDIIKYAKQRLKWKLEYTNIAKDMLPKNFRMSQLQEIYEIVLWEKIDKRNFWKKIFKLNMIEETWELDKSTNRPAKLYNFIDTELKIYNVM